MKSRQRLLGAVLIIVTLAAIAAAPAFSQVGSTASVALDSGPHKGRYDFAPTEACVIAAFGNKPLGLSIVLTSPSASLSIDMPNVDEKHSKEIQVVLVRRQQGLLGRHCHDSWPWRVVQGGNPWACTDSV